MPDTKNKKPPRNPVQGDHLQTVLDTITQRLGNSTRTGGGGGRRTNAVEAGGEQNIKPVVVPVGSAAEASTAPTRFQAPTIGSTRTIADIPTTADPETGLYGPSKREDYSTGRVGGLMGGFQIGAKMGEGKDPMYAMGATLGAGLAGLFNPSKLDEIRYRADQDIIDQENQRVLMRSRASRELQNMKEQEELRKKQQQEEAFKAGQLATIADQTKSPDEIIAASNNLTTRGVQLSPEERSVIDRSRTAAWVKKGGFKDADGKPVDPLALTDVDVFNIGQDVLTKTRSVSVNDFGIAMFQDENGGLLAAVDPTTRQRVQLPSIMEQRLEYIRKLAESQGKTSFTGVGDDVLKQAVEDSMKILEGAEMTETERVRNLTELVKAHVSMADNSSAPDPKETVLRIGNTETRASELQAKKAAGAPVDEMKQREQRKNAEIVKLTEDNIDTVGGKKYTNTNWIYYGADKGTPAVTAIFGGTNKKDAIGVPYTLEIGAVYREVGGSDPGYHDALKLQNSPNAIRQVITETDSKGRLTINRTVKSVVKGSDIDDGLRGYDYIVVSSTSNGQTKTTVTKIKKIGSTKEMSDQAFENWGKRTKQ